jgi:hypothetical protein
MAKLTANVDLGLVERTFADGLLLTLQEALQRTPAGGLFALVSHDGSIAEGLDQWARLTQNSIVEISEEPAGTRYVLRKGPTPADEPVALGERLWLYTNFDCNLACDYCCVRSSPHAERRALKLETVRQLAREAPGLGVKQLFVTGGEPLLLPYVAELLAICSEALPTTVLTNGILLLGKRLRELDGIDRRRLCFQISIDSPEPGLHDAHRGSGTWEKAMRGIRAAREAGFRVRWAATVEGEEAGRMMNDFLDRMAVAEEDRVVRPVARRGSAEAGIVLSRADLAPELTVTADGVFWHPVGAEDRDLFILRDPVPLSNALAALEREFEREHALERRMLKVFHCA